MYSYREVTANQKSHLMTILIVRSLLLKIHIYLGILQFNLIDIFRG